MHAINIKYDINSKILINVINLSRKTNYERHWELILKS